MFFCEGKDKQRRLPNPSQRSKNAAVAPSDGVSVWEASRHRFHFNLRLKFQGCVPPALLIFTCLSLFACKHTGCVCVAVSRAVHASGAGLVSAGMTELGLFNHQLCCVLAFTLSPQQLAGVRISPRPSGADRKLHPSIIVGLLPFVLARC